MKIKKTPQNKRIAYSYPSLTGEVLLYIPTEMALPKPTLSLYSCVSPATASFRLSTVDYLLNRAAMDGRLVIPEVLIARLKEYTPENVEAFSELLNDFKALGEMEGFDYEGGIVRMDFPYDGAHPEHWVAYAGLVGRIIHAAKAASHVKAELQTSENEKYYMRAWLLRLGYGGADLKAERKLLLRNLNGRSAFPDDAAAEKHNSDAASFDWDTRRCVQ